MKGKHKIQDKYEREVYVIVARDRPDIPVYRVRRDDGVGGECTLHRNHLLPVVWPLQVEEVTQEPELVMEKDPPVQQDVAMVEDGDSSEGEDEDGVGLEVYMAPAGAEQPPLPASHHPPGLSLDMPVEEDTMGISPSTCRAEQRSEVDDVDQEQPQPVAAASPVPPSPPPPLQEASYLPEEEFEESAQPQVHARPQRNRRRPYMYGNPVLYQQQATTDWTLRVQYLQSLIVLYPHLEEQLLTCIMHVVSHC